MDNGSILARLNPGVADMSAEGTQTDRSSVIDGLTVAGALAGLERPQYLLLLFLFTFDESVLPELRRLILVRASNLREITERTRQRGPGDIARMIELGLQQLINNGVCRACDGNGAITSQNGQNRIECNVCGGTGHKAWSQEKCAQVIGVSQQAYGKYWQSQCDAVLAMLLAWEGEGLAHVRKRLR